MITRIKVAAFKSIEQLEIELGQPNVFVGANGSGKSNLLEALGVLSAAADGKVTDQTLMQHGVRPGVPKLYKSPFHRVICASCRTSISVPVRRTATTMFR